MSQRIIVPAERWSACVVEAILRRLPAQNSSSCSIALPGGSTPKAFFPGLVEAFRGRPESRPQCHFWFGDERGVPPDHAESNWGLAQRMLFDPLGLPRQVLHRMPADRADREVAALQHDREFPTRLDLLILGLGTDGHYASIFPGSRSVHETTRRIVPSEAPSGVTARMTITPRVVREAAAVLVVVSGANKAQAVANALANEGLPERTPARQLRDADWIMDQEAASLLHEEESL